MQDYSGAGQMLILFTVITIIVAAFATWSAAVGSPEDSIGDKRK